MSEVQGDTPEVEISADQAMENTIRETYEKIQSRGDSVEEVKEETPENVETEEQKVDRARDEAGRFVKNVATEVPTPPAEPEAPAATLQAPVATPISPELQRLGLKKEEADEIAKNPIALQAIMRRSEEMHKGLEQYREKAQFGTMMEQAISPFMGTINALNIKPEVAINKLLATDNLLRYGTPLQKQQAFAQIAQDYGIDLGQEFTANLPKVDPQLQSLQTELHQMKSWIEQQNQARQQQEDSHLIAEVNNFTKDKQFIDDVSIEMQALLPAIVANYPQLSHQEKLQKAYDAAIYANPTVRAQVLAQQQKQADEARKQETIQKAQAAKKASVVNLPRKGVLPSQKPIGTMDDTIRETAERLGLI